MTNNGMFDETDILVVGAGPAGLMLGAQLARIGNVDFRIVDRRAAAPEMGNADGVQVRSVEIFDAFGFADEVLREAYHVVETSFWRTNPDGELKRQSRGRDTPLHVSTFPHVILAQNKIMDHLTNVMRESEHGNILYSSELVDVSMPQSTERSSHPVHATLVDVRTKEARVVRCKYLVSMEGAHSFVRRHFDVRFEGEHTTAVWGVMDVFVNTTFPDIRVKSVVQTPDRGNLLIIPREGGQLVRFYIELAALQPGERLPPNAFTVDKLIERAQGILAPFELDVKQVQWWSNYQVGQKVAETFSINDDSGHARIFLGGDASHSHSPKAGQGMNVSMQDAFNLGWKLAHVVSGKANHTLLHTYDSERRSVAQQLIAFDHKFAKAFVDGQAQNRASFEEMFKEQELFTAGLATCYKASSLGCSVRQSDHPLLGRRFPPAQVVRHCDAKVTQLLSLLKADGHWRLFVFGGDVCEPEKRQRLEQVCDVLQSHKHFQIDKSSKTEKAFIQTLFVLANARDEVELNDLPSFCTPTFGRLGLRSNDQVYCDTESYHQGHGHAYDVLNIPASGCLILVRPDQYISEICELSDVKSILAILEATYSAATR